MKNDTVKAVIYTRFSPRPGAEKSQSCEAQKDACETYCKEQGYEVAAYFEDRSAKGADAERPGLWAAIEELRKGWVLVAYKYDRLAREVMLHELIKRDVDRRDATIEIVSGGVNGDGPEANMIRQVLAAFGEYERRVLAIRTKMAMLYHQRNGRRMSRYAPYGYSIDPENPKRLLRNPEEQEVIEQMLLWGAEGLTVAEIVRTLNSEGIKTRNGGKWHHKVANDIIKRAGAEGKIGAAG